jgi:hypothetical protein
VENIAWMLTPERISNGRVCKSDGELFGELIERLQSFMLEYAVCVFYLKMVFGACVLLREFSSSQTLDRILIPNFERCAD